MVPIAPGELDDISLKFVKGLLSKLHRISKWLTHLEVDS